MPKKGKRFNVNKYQREWMREKRKEEPKYGKPAFNRITIAYCRQCKEERHWIDARRDDDGIFLCQACGQPLYSLREQPRAKKKAEGAR